METHTFPLAALSDHACERVWPGAATFAPASRITIDLSHQQKRGPSVLRHAQTASRSLSVQYGDFWLEWYQDSLTAAIPISRHITSSHGFPFIHRHNNNAPSNRLPTLDYGFLSRGLVDSRHRVAHLHLRPGSHFSAILCLRHLCHLSAADCGYDGWR